MVLEPSRRTLRTPEAALVYQDTRYDRTQNRFRGVMRLLTKTALACLSTTSVLGGSFTTDFSNPTPTNVTLNGTATIKNGMLIVSPRAGGQGGCVLDDLDAGAAIESFTASFGLR